jgi:hypothetical protein
MRRGRRSRSSGASKVSEAAIRLKKTSKWENSLTAKNLKAVAARAAAIRRTAAAIIEYYGKGKGE